MNSNLVANELKYLEPIGGSIPKISTGTDYFQTKKSLNSLSLSCPAQAHPVPGFR